MQKECVHTKKCIWEIYNVRKLMLYEKYCKDYVQSKNCIYVFDYTTDDILK